MSGFTLAQLKPRIVDVDIVQGGDVIMTVPMAALSWSEWQELALTVEDPKPPKKRMVVEGKVVPDYEDKNDPEYLKALADAGDERLRRRLVTALIRGGNLDELKDKPIEEQAQAIKDIDRGYAMALTAALGQLVTMTRHEVRVTSGMFRDEPIHESRYANTAKNGVVSLRLAEPASE